MPFDFFFISFFTSLERCHCYFQRTSTTSKQPVKLDALLSNSLHWNDTSGVSYWCEVMRVSSFTKQKEWKREEKKLKKNLLFISSFLLSPMFLIDIKLTKFYLSDRNEREFSFVDDAWKAFWSSFSSPYFFHSRKVTKYKSTKSSWC